METNIRQATLNNVKDILQIYAEALDNGKVLSVEKAQRIFLK
ncbi:MAG: hypothetical protein U5M51_05185 [Emticicia sp.]|nr:hypothetical protein [Emticicia sp.]